MPRIAFIGAGSTVVTRNLVGDVLRQVGGYRPATVVDFEVPCAASDRGMVPQAVGTLPRHLAALMQTQVNVQGLAVEAALSEPVDALIDAHGDLIPALR